MKSKENMVQLRGLRSSSTEDLALLGIDQLAYIRSHKVNGVAIYVVYGANGQELAGFDNYSAAMTACYENELEPIALQ